VDQFLVTPSFPDVRVWSGTQLDGSAYGGNLPLGAPFPDSGRLDLSTSQWIANGNTLPTEQYRLYGLSQQLVVPPGATLVPAMSPSGLAALVAFLVATSLWAIRRRPFAPSRLS
jgi:hypothetical protein